MDLTANTQLETLNCSSNNLSRFTVKNGNNTALTTFSITGNSALLCVEVDDVEWSTTHWTSKDVQTNYSAINCYTYVPDDNFEQALIDLGYDDVLDDYVLTDKSSLPCSAKVTEVSCGEAGLIRVKEEGWTGLSEEQPCQPEENPVHPDSFTRIYILSKIGFLDALP